MNLSREEFLAYTNDQLSPERKAVIDQYLTKNPLERKALEGASTLKGDVSFDSLLNELEAQIDQVSIPSPASNKPTIVETIKKNWLLLLLIFALAGTFAYLQMNTTTEELQYANYFEAYPDVVTSTVRGSTTNESTLIFEAFAAYNKDDFKKASKLFSQITEANSIDERLTFYHAVSLTGAGQYEDAYAIWKQLSNNPGFPYMDGVYWNQAICAISLGYRTEAKALLNLVIDENLYKKEEAIALLKQLEK